jgi:heterodisulfide reductase subunit A-like polyferredoxin
MTILQIESHNPSVHASNTNDSRGLLPEQSAPSGISVVIVGAGVAGLMASLECWRKGHEVRIIEKSATRILSGKQTTLSCHNVHNLTQ